MNSRGRFSQRLFVLLTAAVCVGTGATSQETIAANAMAESQDISGTWHVLGDRPTADDRYVPLDTTARISPAGNAVTVYIDGKTLQGEYRSGHLTARLDTSIPATGRSGKGRTHVGQVWELSLVATAPDRLEGWYSVTHSGFQASEAAKNGLRAAPVTLTRLGADLALIPAVSSSGRTHPKDAATDTAYRGHTGTGFAYIAWEYAESSKTDIPVLLRCDALGLNKILRRGERGLVKAGAGDYRLLIQDPDQGPPNWNDQYLTLYVEPSNDLSLVISTNGPSDERAAVIQVLVDGQEIVREYLMAN